MNQIIAIDIGTTHCKAVTVDENGCVIKIRKETYPVICKEPGQSEQEPGVIFRAVISLLQQSLNENIICVCFSAAMHGIMAVDKNGKPLTNLITWADTRSKLYAEQLLKNENADLIYERTGTPLHPMSPLCKLLWIKNKMPEVFAKTDKFISIKEYIFYKLFCKYIVDYSIASATGLFDIYKLKWLDIALYAAEISPEKLSVPVACTHSETKLSEEYQLLFQIKKNIPFVIGGNDGCLANLGCGAIEENEAALTIGTSGAVRAVNKNKKTDKQKRLFNYILTENIFITGGGVNNGGNVLEWFRENFLDKNDSVETLLSLAGSASAGSKKLLFLPYLFGERAPVWDANAQGVFFGLNNLHKKEHLARAVVEGISFALYSVFIALEEINGKIERVYAGGGFVQSKFWLQLLADMFGKKIIVSSNADASAMGAAFMGMYATGIINDLQEIKQFLKDEEVFEPDKKVHQQYQKSFPVFQSLYPKLKDSFEALANL